MSALRAPATTTTASKAARAGCSRVRQVTAAGRHRSIARRFVVRAAEEEAPVESPDAPVADNAVADDDFAFSYSEAKRNNEYQPSDVEAALKFYTEGTGDLPYEQDFVGNPLGIEDAALFDDIDNEDVADDYAMAGIPEAAPKTKRGGRGRRGEQEEEDNDEVLMEVESEKITAAALDEMGYEGDDLDVDERNAPWTWSDGAGRGDTWQLQAYTGGVADTMMAELAALDLSNVEDAALDQETKDLASMLVEDLAADVENLDDEDEGELVVDDTPALTAAEEAEIDAVLAEPLPDMPTIEGVEAIQDQEGGEPLDQEEVAAYIEALRAVQPAAAEAIQQAAGDEIQLEEAAVPSVDVGPLPANLNVDLAAELLTEDPSFEAALDAEEDLPTEAIMKDLAELEAIPACEYSAAVFPEDQDLLVFQDLIEAADGYLANMPPGEEEDLPLEAAEDDFEDVNMFDDLPEDLVARTSALLEDDGSDDEPYVERVLELSRVTKVVKGGKIMGFRAVVVVGNGAGKVGVGCQSGREVGTAVKRALVDAKKRIIQVPLVGAGTIPHRIEAWNKGAGVVILPAAEGTGVIAGSSIRSVLELAGVQNVLAKRLGSRSQLNNARVAIQALSQLRTMEEVARTRDLPLSYLLQ